MYFVEHKVILPVTDDILRQTGGIRGLRERVRGINGMYLSTDEDEIILPFVVVNGTFVMKIEDILSLFDKLKIEYNSDELKLVIKDTKYLENKIFI